MEPTLVSFTQSELSATACEAIRFTFNPSGDQRVNTIKALTARLITELEAIRDEGRAGREAAVAITNVQTASMWAVLAATKGK